MDRNETATHRTTSAIALDTSLHRRSFLKAAAGIGVAALTVNLASSTSKAGAQEADAADAAAATQYKTTTDLNFRAGPGTWYAVITVIPAGGIVAHTGAIQNGFYEVGYGGTYGWVSGDYIVPVRPGRPSRDPNFIGEASTITAVNLRSGPSTGHSVLRVIPGGTWVVTSDLVQNGFRYVVALGTAGWISDQFLAWSTDDPPAQETFTTTAALNLRAAPSITAEILLVMPEGAVVKAEAGAQNGYRQVAYQGVTGWAATAFLN